MATSVRLLQWALGYLLLTYVLAQSSSSDIKLEKLSPYAKSCFVTFDLCFVSASRDQSFGCGLCDPDQVQYGPVEFLNTTTQIRNFISRQAPEKRAILLPTEMYLSGEAMNLLQDNPEQILAVYIEQESDPAMVQGLPDRGFSPARKSPNAEFSASPETRFDWNPLGNSRRFESFSFPVYAVPTEIIREVESNVTRLRKIGDEYPRNEIQPGGIMWACGETSQTCLERGTCQPVGGHSAWVATSSLDEGADELIAVSATLDTTGFFPETARGAWEATGIAALIGAAEAFARFKNSSDQAPVRTPVFFGFYGESFGYAGSHMLLNDVRNFSCNEVADFSDEKRRLIGCLDPYMPSLRFEKLRDKTFSAHVHVGPVGTDSTLHVHTRGAEGDNRAVQLLQDGFRDVLTVERDAAFDGSAGLPPSSSQSFVKLFPDVPTATLTDYERAFDFKFYESMFDARNQTPAWLQRTCDAARGIGRTIVGFAFDTMPSVAQEDFVNCTFVEEIYGCLIASNFTSECRIGREYFPEDSYEWIRRAYEFANFSQAYPAVYAPLPVTEKELPTRLVRQSIMRYLLGDLFAESFDEEVTTCQSNYDCYDFMAAKNEGRDAADFQEAICSRGRCIITEAHFHRAWGSGIESRDAAGNEYDVTEDNDGPAFTESRWDGYTGYCMATQDAPEMGRNVLIAGVFVWVASLLLLGVLHRLLSGKIPADTDPRAFTV
mmetsp:Transcript_3227/g.9842  ORF Transcript_3227/g.9842 Transcript_3227/m.9842 type:complete len:718 (+) Transcript_3227:306-2459(+)